MELFWYTREELIDAVGKEIIPTKIVMDVGPGIRPQSFFIPLIQIIVEPFLPYIERVRLNPDCFARNVYICNTWDKVLPKIAAKSIDTIFAIDVIEHFTKSEGKTFIEQAQRVAKKQIVIFTPLGFYPQDYQENDVDRWGMNGGEWQAHKSGWLPTDFDGDWKIFACNDFHEFNQNEKKLNEPIGAFFAILSFEKTITPIEDRLVMEEIRIFEIIKYCAKRIVSSLQIRFIVTKKN